MPRKVLLGCIVEGTVVYRTCRGKGNDDYLIDKCQQSDKGCIYKINCIMNKRYKLRKTTKNPSSITKKGDTIGAYNSTYGSQFV